MKYVNLGRSGLKVSRIALGCMSFGVEARAWRLDEAASRPFVQRGLGTGHQLLRHRRHVLGRRERGDRWAGR